VHVIEEIGIAAKKVVVIGPVIFYTMKSVAEITDQVVDFYNALFLKVFLDSFNAGIQDRRRRDAVGFQVLEAAGAASQSLERFFLSQRLTNSQVDCVLGSLEFVGGNLTLEQIANPYTQPETVVHELLKLPVCTAAQERVIKAEQVAVYRVALTPLFRV